MRLKRLELAGFKSFAQKTVLDFSGSITAIVGPNGSGKSNVIDAFRWLLGERDAKQMRGGKSEDLIFAGSAHAPAMSLAQATLHFDNSDGFFPLPQAEVMIKRKVGRDGVQEYFVNGAEVRLKDILRFFAQSRMGARGFSIVSQGDSDLFVRALPEARRAMIEEVLGLKQYQIKKHESELSLRQTEANLEKTRALLDEILPHLKMLRKTAARFSRHDELRAALSEIQRKYFTHKVHATSKIREQWDEKLSQTQREETAARREYDIAEERYKEIEKAMPKANTHDSENNLSQELSLELSRLERALGKIEAEEEYNKNKVTAGLTRETCESALRAIEAVLQRGATSDTVVLFRAVISEAQEIINMIFNSPAKQINFSVEFDTKKKEYEEKILKIRQAFDAQRAIGNKEREGLREFTDKYRTAHRELESAQTRLSLAHEAVNAIEIEKAKLSVREEDLQKEIHEANLNERSLGESDPVHCDETLALKEILHLRGELSSIGAIDPSLLNEAKDTEQRYSFLNGQVEDLGKASLHLGTLIRDLDSKIHTQFKNALFSINKEFQSFFALMFGGGKARLTLENRERGKTTGEIETQEQPAQEERGGIEIEVSIPRKKIKGLAMLSGGERSLVSLAALFALISVSPPPFIVLDEVDAALDDANTKRFADLIKTFSHKTQFIIVTHNRSTMASASALYGVTMKEDGTSRVLSLRLDSK